MNWSFSRALAGGTSPFAKDVFEPQIGRTRRSSSGGAKSPSLSLAMDKRLGRIKRFGVSTKATLRADFVSHASDPRQRAIVKVHYFSNVGGGGAAMRTHARYITRDGVSRDNGLDPEAKGQGVDRAREPELEQDAADRHARYLSREAEVGFYDRFDDGVDGAARMADWSRADTRHFRVILAPENGGRIGDLHAYTREVMARAEETLNRGPLEWVAVDHWDTDNPHSHLVLRGRLPNGRPLGLPREFVRHRFREIARDVATERLGPRSRDDERLALEREVRTHGRTRLDRAIADRLDENGQVRLAELSREAGDPELARRLRSRADELMRLGLAGPTSPGHARFVPDWQQRLDAMEMHLDVRRRVVRERWLERELDRAGEKLSRQSGKPFQDRADYEQSWRVRETLTIGDGKYLALERWDAVTLAPMPRGIDISPGQQIQMQRDRSVTRAVRDIGPER